jgi:hypothetical protein
MTSRRHDPGSYAPGGSPKTTPAADDMPVLVSESSGVTSVTEIRARLCELHLERLEAESNGLVRCKPYMDDLDAEWADQQEALVRAALDEILALRSELGNRQFG